MLFVSVMGDIIQPTTCVSKVNTTMPFPKEGKALNIL